MPRFALALTLLAGCFFDADYSRAHLRCTDGTCPSGLSCVAEMCVAGNAGSDAAVHDAAHDAPDARQAALTCADPGDLTIPQTGSLVVPGTTAGHVNSQSTSCGGAVYNGADAIYRVQGPLTITIGIDSTAGLAAYALGACTGFPTCELNTAATSSAPLTITLPAGMQLIVVDGIVANVTGTYTLTITR